MSQRRRLITEIHDSPTRACIAVTGGGTSALAALFSQPGASRTVIDAQIPYARAALDAYISSSSDAETDTPVTAAIGSATREMANLMAIAAYRRAVSLTAAEEPDQPASPDIGGTGSATHPIVGIAATAAIATDRTRRGDNRAHVAWHDGNQTVITSITMHKGTRDRVAEEQLCADIILNAIAQACSIETRINLNLVDGDCIETDLLQTAAPPNGSRC